MPRGLGMLASEIRSVMKAVNSATSVALARCSSLVVVLLLLLPPPPALGDGWYSRNNLGVQEHKHSQRR